MGLLLLVGAVGSLVALPLSGMVIERLGARRTVLAFALLNATRARRRLDRRRRSAQVPVVGLGLVLFGVGTGVWDASMNVEGAVVEQHLGRTVMPRYHAGFSFGTVAAAGVAAVAAGLHVPVVVHIPVAVVAVRVGVAFAVRAVPARRPTSRELSPDAPDAAREGRPRSAGRLARAAHPAHRPRRPRRRAHRGVGQRLGQPRGRRRLRRAARARRPRVRDLRRAP